MNQFATPDSVAELKPDLDIEQALQRRIKTNHNVRGKFDRRSLRRRRSS